ncbi:caspase family protein [Actinomadura sp. NEAU-AAG7]|uniref:caspase, EACC1-associated type n=1 Tax=Actinomadura sp. NEAU-AAG7 TaxID=2839640 RepID=UPI001BE47CAD|nr:caspase family protein [Actinomadura sp. NEAU-AAG7]MBT2210560.1 caspase family protein [Actinomadura sp. NEAU-AAG7]
MARPTEPRTDLADSRALLIGTSHFHDDGFTGVPAAANSVAGMYEMLTDPARGGWPRDQVTTITNPHGAAWLVQRIRRMTETTTGAFLLYYVGHGVISERGNLTLTLTDTTATDPDLTGVEFDHIQRALGTSPARVSVVILDCCYSGRAISALSALDTVADSTSIEGVYTLTAAEGPAHVVPFHQQHSTGTSFTQELLDLINEGLPDGPELLTFHSLYGPLAHRLHRRGLPRPNQRGTDTVHHFGLSRNTAYGRLPRPRDDDPVLNSGSGWMAPRPITTPSPAPSGTSTPVFSSRIRAGKVLTSRLGAQHLAFMLLAPSVFLPYATESTSQTSIVPLIIIGAILGTVLALFVIILVQFCLTLAELVRPRRLNIGPEGVSIVWGSRRANYTWDEIATLEVANTGRERPTLMLWRKPTPWGRPAHRTPRLGHSPRRPPWEDRATGWIRICYLDQLQRGRELEELLPGRAPWTRSN